MMGSTLRSWFEPSSFSPHGFCLLWDPGLIWLHALSDLGIAFAYFSIPLALFVFLRRRRDFEFPRLIVLFAAFILLCGATHLFGVLTLWQPYYWLEGALKAVTALVSIATAVVMWPLIPQAVALPSPSALREVNQSLERQIAEREALLHRLGRREAELTEMTASLERRVAERTESLAVVNRRFDTALAASGVTVFTQDRRLAYTWISHGALGRPAEDFIGRTDAEMMPEAVVRKLSALKQGVLDSGEPARGEIEVQGKWFDLTVEPLRDAPGIICGAIDITRRKQDEVRIRFLLDEVKHRVGNLLGVAQAMLRQTAADSASIEDLVERFGTRLRSLAGSQLLLVREGAQAATLREVIDAQLGHFTDEKGSQVEIAGPHLALEETAVLHIGMAMHELATNAAKYGALSAPGGRVRIGWEVSEGACHLHWREMGGPPVQPGTRRGFGREVIEWAVAQAVHGTVELDLHPEGLRWDLRFPLPKAAAAA